MSSRKAPSASTDDSDLEDLLSHKGTGKTETPLNLDDLTKGQLDVPSNRSFGGPGVTAVASAHCRYLCFMYPKCCGCLSVMSVAFVMFFVIGAVLNPTETFGVIKNDYTDIQSEYDLSLGKIDHWCLKGDNDSCRCEDPLEPNSRIEFKTWNAAHKENKKTVEAYRESDMLDIAFVGESLVEEMDGRWMGRQQGDELKGIEKSFKKQFKREKSGIEGVALGIAGDTSPNVLWRLLHGEMPADFNPRVWWLVLGMNDLGRMQCSEEVVVLGILRVVEEIKTRKPDAHIVINSMLPMADLRGGLYPQMQDYKDAFKQYKGKRPGRTSPQNNPALYARKPNGAQGGSAAQQAAVKAAVEGAAKVRYARPEKTTQALRNRHMGGFRPAQGGPRPGAPGGANPGANPGARGGAMRSNAVNGGGGAAGDAGAPVKQAMSGVAKAPPKKSESDKAGRRLKKKESSDEDGKDAPPKKTKAEKKAEKKYIKKIKKDPVNPKLNLEKKKIKARDAKKLFLAKNRLPLWTSINAINKQLNKFAEKHDGISFFDATDVFAERSEDKKYVLQSDKISIRGHPTQSGFEDWEEAIAKKLKKIFEKDDEALAKEVEAAEKAKADAEAAAAAATVPAAKSSDDDKKSSDEDDKKKDKEDSQSESDDPQ